MARSKDKLYIGVGGHVAAIDTGTGEELWRRKLKTASFVTVWTDRAGLYAGCNGELYALDPATGTIRWHNKLKGLGIGLVAFPGSDGSGDAGAAAAAEAAAAAAAAV